MKFISPEGYNRIKTVNSFDELVTTPLGPEINALCWSRILKGNFDELAAAFVNENEIISLDEEALSDVTLGTAARVAAEVAFNDLHLLREHGLIPSLECVPRYMRDDGPVPTDVYSFHVDTATVPTDTYLCSYNGPASEGLRNDQAQRHIDIPATRAELLKLFQQQNEPGDFEAYLRENCYDLHYAATTGAVPFSFGIGNLWRIAVQYPGSPVCLPYIARQPPRKMRRRGSC